MYNEPADFNQLAGESMSTEAAGLLADLDSKTERCIRCGFCLDACPTFRLTGQETLSPRGRIYLVKSWREGTISLDHNVQHALDSCLGCRACETACPSGVEYGTILEMARTEMERAKIRPPLEAFARKQLLNVLTSPGLLSASLRAGKWMGGLTGGRMPAVAARLLSGTSAPGPRLPVAHNQSGTASPPERSPASAPKRFTVAILEGCVMRVLFTDTNRATIRVLQANGCDVIAPRNAQCCGALHVHAGLHEDALQRIRALVDSFSPYLNEIDAIVINSAGCGSTLREYGELLKDDNIYSGRARLLSSKIRDICEWLEEIGPAAMSGEVNLTVSYHDACHLAHGQRIREQPRTLLQRIPGLTLVEMDEADTCCGSAGTYNITEPVLAAQLLKRKIAHIQETGATTIVTGNPGCLAWIEQGLEEQGLKVRICHPVELLDAAYNRVNLQEPL